jgi:hypothetical protein
MLMIESLDGRFRSVSVDPQATPPQKHKGLKTGRKTIPSTCEFVLASRLGCRLLNPTVMNRREAVLTGLASLAAAVTAPPAAKSQTSESKDENPELEPLRALLKALTLCIFRPWATLRRGRGSPASIYYG